MNIFSLKMLIISVCAISLGLVAHSTKKCLERVSVWFNAVS